MDNINLKSEAEKTIENIYRFKNEKCKNFSLIETIIEYSYQKDISLQEIGNILSEHEIFVNIFKKQLRNEKFFKKTAEELENEENELDEDEW